MDSNEDFERVKAFVLSAHADSTAESKIKIYDGWAKNYDQDLSVLGYSAPVHAAQALSLYFTGNRGTARVLDVACGTGLAAKQLERIGFRHFVGVDGSQAMLEMAKGTGLYQDLNLCIMGSQPLPFEHGAFEVVMIIGALSDGQVPVKVVKELCMLTKPRGFTCLTTRSNKDNLVYKASLEQEMKALEEQGLWRCVQTVDVGQWERAVSHHEKGFISGAVYIYQKL